MSKTLVAISGYSGDQHQIENNWGVYAHHGHPILILSPEDAPIPKINTSQNISAGEKGWIGPQTLVRQQLFLRELLNQNFDYYLFHDADSVCLEPNIPKYLYDSPHVFWSNEVPDLNPSPSRLPKIALQPPYFFSLSVLRALFRHSVTPAMSFYRPVKQKAMPLPTECIDHWMLQIVYSAGIPHVTFPDGASFETTSEHGLNTMSEHVRAHGKVFIHQVKTRPVLDRLLSDRQIFIDTHK